MEEIWKDIQGFEGRYQVSNLGRVRYPDTWIMRPYPNGNVVRIRTRKAGIKSFRISNLGYYYVALTKNKSKFKRTYNVDELVAIHFCNGYMSGMPITHKDGNRFNNDADNLVFAWPEDLSGEVWKPIMGFEGLYEISNMGRVTALDRTKKRNYKYTKNVDVPVDRMILKPNVLKSGYAHVILHKEGVRKEFSLHRLVALHFCDGYAEGLVVNHKDENKQNNRADNLEWCTEEYNRNYGTHYERCAKSNQKRVAQYTHDGVLIAEYDSGKEASEKTGFHRACISDWCRGAHPCKAGYIWKFL